MLDARLALARAVLVGASRLPGAWLGRPTAPVDGQTPDAALATIAYAADRLQPYWENLPPVASREAFTRVVRMTASRSPRLEEVRDVDLDGLTARLYRPDAAISPALVYFHGGGGAVGDLETADDGCRWLAVTSGWSVVSVDYRLGPEDPYPAALDDAIRSYRLVRETGAKLPVDPERVAVGGDSFGGMLATQVCRRMNLDGGPRPIGQLLIYPLCDHREATSSRRQFADRFILSTELRRRFERWTFAERSHALSEWASPLVATDLSGLPPALVVTAGLDPLRDEGRAYAKRLAEAGVRSAHLEFDGLMHGFVHFMGVSPASHAAWQRLSRRWAWFVGEHGPTTASDRTDTADPVRPASDGLGEG